VPRTFEDLVTEADSVSVDGWDFSWLAGRATEERRFVAHSCRSLIEARKPA
jgi:hypothetical protein